MREMIGRLDEIAGQLKRIGDALEALSVVAKEGKETFPPNTPYKEKGENNNNNPRARARAKAFVKPTVDEVSAYIRGKGYAFDASQFVAYYEANGWKVGRNPMRDWKAACVTWQRREQARSKPEAAYGRRKADNWIPSTETERRGFADALGR